MNFQSLSYTFNRALKHTFSKKKFLVVFCLLFFSGLLIVFFRGLSLHASQWVRLSLTFLPIFLFTGLLLSMGVWLIRIYHDEVKQREVSYWQTFSRSWEVMIGASYFAIPIILSYLLLWFLLGIFVLLREIPAAGEFFSVILSFAPFLINFGTLILCLISIALLFFVSPLIAFKGLDRGAIFQITAKRLEKDPFANLVLWMVSIIPLVFIICLLILAAKLTGSVCVDCQTPLQTVLKWFFIMVPFTGCLTWPIVFFFNYAAEAHVLMMQKNHE